MFEWLSMDAWGLGGYFGLFLSAFLAATILPIYSEAVFVGLQAEGSLDLAMLWGVATAGNTLGSCVNWALAVWFLHWQDRKWFPFTPKQLERGHRWFEKWGVWSLLLSWAPVIGDPITFVAGFLRVHFGLFFVLVLIAKGGRYFVLLLITQGFL